MKKKYLFELFERIKKSKSQYFYEYKDLSEYKEILNALGYKLEFYKSLKGILNYYTRINLLEPLHNFQNIENINKFYKLKNNKTILCQKDMLNYLIYTNKENFIITDKYIKSENFFSLIEFGKKIFFVKNYYYIFV